MAPYVARRAGTLPHCHAALRMDSVRSLCISKKRCWPRKFREPKFRFSISPPQKMKTRDVALSPKAAWSIRCPWVDTSCLWEACFSECYSLQNGTGKIQTLQILCEKPGTITQSFASNRPTDGQNELSSIRASRLSSRPRLLGLRKPLSSVRLAKPLRC